MFGLILFGIVVLIAVIVLFMSVVHINTGSATAPTATVAPTVTPIPTVVQSPIPTAPAVASQPSASEKAASMAACAPFLTAGQDPKGAKKWGKPPKVVMDTGKQYQVKMYTDKGTITAAMLAKDAPTTANNFLFLSCKGFYNNVIFHRVISGFMIQGGDPLGTGTGGPGYTIPDEKVARPYEIGDLAMANTGQPNSGGSQFFIIQGSQGVSLPQSYSLFGHVTQGQNVVDAIATAPVHSSNGESSAPNNPVHIRTITVQVS
jgi:cyclophilin family peptidyl-prolyl cis-trans isomerase